jgi:hypothetical protein
MEHRFLWEPQSSAPLAFLDLRLGPLRDIAELVIL